MELTDRIDLWRVQGQAAVWSQFSTTNMSAGELLARKQSAAEVGGVLHGFTYGATWVSNLLKIRIPNITPRFSQSGKGW